MTTYSQGDAVMNQKLGQTGDAVRTQKLGQTQDGLEMASFNIALKQDSATLNTLLAII